MAYQIDFQQPFADECRRIALEQIDKSLRELDDDCLSIHERVHQFRKRAKKVRALVRLYRPADEEWYRDANVKFRDLARDYSDLRDAQAAVGTLDDVTDYFAAQIEADSFNSIRHTLMRERHRQVDEVDDARLPALRQALEGLRVEVGEWPDFGGHKMPMEAQRVVIVAGFSKVYRRGRAAMQGVTIDAGSDLWHEWRKRVKYQRYHWKLLRGLWPSLINCWRSELHRLSDYIGDDHDLVELAKRLNRVAVPCEPKTVEALLGLIRQRSQGLRAQALPLGRRLFADKPKAAEARLTRWLKEI